MSADPQKPQIPIPFEMPRFACALRGAWREGYHWPQFRADLLAGITVGIVALPLAMALAIASGVPPQYGLYTAIVAGALIPLLGGARFNVSGPTAAFVVILAPVSAKFGLAGLLVATLIAGVLLLALGFAGFGQWIKYIPYPVTTGFTAGIALVIATLQMKDFLGLTILAMPAETPDKVGALIHALPTMHWPDFVVGATSLSILILWPKITKRVPGALIATAVGAVLGYAFSRLGADWKVATIGTRFTWAFGDQSGTGIPPLAPMLVLPWNLPGANGEAFHATRDVLRQLVGPAFAIAMLGAIESLLCAVVADGMTGEKHDPDAELVAQGFGNLVAPFFGGISATGAIARTAANIRAGAFSPLSAVIHSIFLLSSVVVLAPLLSYLPMSSLAALLLVVAWNMSDARHFVHALRVAPRSDVSVMLACFLLTVVFDMTIGVTVGVILAALLFMKRMSELTDARFVEAGHPTFPKDLPRRVLFYEIAGPMFFGAAEKAMSTLDEDGRTYRAVIFNLERVPAMDLTGLVAFEEAIRELRSRGTLVILANVQPQPLNVLTRAGLKDSDDGLVFCDDIDEALFVVRGSYLDPADYDIPGVDSARRSSSRDALPRKI